MPHYSTTERRAYIRSQRDHKYFPELRDGYSYRDIAWDVKSHFGLESPPSPATIKNDLEVIKRWDNKRDRTLTAEAAELLEPENFPKWRASAFVAPGTNEPYETPKHQMAWFWLFVALALKITPPDWVIEYLGVEELDIPSWAEDPQRLMSLFLLAPPRHGKSDLLAHACIWLILKNPNIRIIWCGGTLPISELTTSWVKTELESNEFLIQNYGPFENESGSWSAGQFVVATRTGTFRAPTMVALGKGSTVLSRDADIIVVDDYVDLRSSESPAQVDRDVRWLKSQLMTRREPWTPLFGIGSHQPSPTGDAYSQLQEDRDSEILFVKTKAHDYTKCRPWEEWMEDEGERHGKHCLLWHSVRPWWFLEAMRKSLGDVLYEVCYNQDERKGRIDYFRPEVLRGEFILPEPGPGGIRGPLDLEASPGILDYRRSYGTIPRCCESVGSNLVSIGFDPASSQGRRASESALIVRAVCPKCGRRYLVDYWKGRVSPEKHPHTILKYVEAYRPLRVRIESVAYQKALARDPRLTNAQSKYGFIIDEWNTDQRKWDPEMGVPLLSRHMEAGKWSVPYQNPQDQRKTEEYIRQYLRWPQEPNDLVMADWFSELSLQGLLEELEYSIPEVEDQDMLSPMQLRSIVTFDLSDIHDEEYVHSF